MTASQRSYVGDAREEVAADNSPEQPVIPNQRGTSPNQSTAHGRGEQKPILSPWTRNRAEFTDKL
jgi:hypothetical protein